MESELNRPTWQLPPGVSRGTWDYVHNESIATQYDSFHAGHPLLDYDCELVLHEAQRIEAALDSEPVGLDLGCGTGRVMLPLVQRRWRVLGLDLSQGMLQEVGSKTQQMQARVGRVRGNLAQLNCLQDNSIDLAYCLYSSVGMVQGRANRRAMLGHVARSLRQSDRAGAGGRFIVHVHNRGTWWQDPGGIRRGLSEWWQSLRDPSWEYGDRVYAYRGLPSMYLHIFSEAELRQDLRGAGFLVERWIRLNRTSSGALARRWLFPYFRAGGFLAVARKAE